MAEKTKQVTEKKDVKSKPKSSSKSAKQSSSTRGNKSNASRQKKESDRLNKKVAEYKKKLETSDEKSKEFHDKYMRLSAEFDNYRKRTLKERMELTKSAGEQILVNLLPVIDDFERGLQTIDESKDIDGVKEGIHLIYNKFTDFLSQNGVKEIEAMEESFNTDIHEAVTKIPAPSKELKEKVVDVIQKGYFLNEKVIRFAKVVIGE